MKRVRARGVEFSSWRFCYTVITHTCAKQLCVPSCACIVGALSAGHIIESGDNANGQYVRFADGTQWCWNKANFGTTSVQQNDNSHVEWTFPAAFVDDNVTIVGTSTGYASSRFVTSISNIDSLGFMIGNFSIQNMTWNLDGATYYFYIAVGKWK